MSSNRKPGGRIDVLVGLGLVCVAILCALPASAAPRSGIDCECTKTGAYVKVSKGSSLKTPVDRSLVVISATQATSPSGTYTLTSATGAGQTTLTISDSGSGATLLRLGPFSVNGSEDWGFSPDDDRFLFTFHSPGKPSGTDTIQLYDLTNLSTTTGPPIYETDLDGLWAALFAPRGGRMLLSSTGGFNGTIFRVVDPSTGDVVFHQGFLPGSASNTAPDFEFYGAGATPWGFSPNGRYLLYHYVSAATGAQRHYVRVYDLSAPAASQTIGYDNAEGTAVLRFSSNSAYLLDAFTTGSNSTALQVRKSSSGVLSYSDSFSFVNNPGNKGDKFKGAAWGFSPRAGNLLYAVDAGPSAVDLYLVNLASRQRVQLVSTPDVTSGFWEFSPCGDVLATVLQDGSGQLVASLYDTAVGGPALYTGNSVLTVVWTFQSTTGEQQVDVGGGGFQTAIANTAASTCTPPVPDTTAPVWDPGATLTALEGAAQGDVDLSWPAATDADSGVSFYAIHQDGSEIATVPAGTLEYTVSGLSSASAHTFKIEAEDDAVPPNRSTDGPSASITLADWAPPVWAPGDALAANNVTASSLDLVWPAASDDTAVSEYHVYRAGGLLPPLDGATTTLAVSGLDWESDYHFEIEATDAAGNVSARLELDVTTSGPPANAQPPSWPGGAVLTLTVLGPESIDLSWPAASGPDGVSGYDIRLNGRRIAQVPDTQTTFSLAGLLPDTDWNLEIVPRNSWRQPGSALAGTGHTDPGTHVDSPIPTPLVSDERVWSDIGFVSSDGRFVTYDSTESSPNLPNGFSNFLYDRETAQVEGIESTAISGDGRHVLHSVFDFSTSPGQYVESRVRDLDTSLETVLYGANWGPTPESGKVYDLSETGDRLLVSVGTAIPGEGYRRQHLIVSGAGGIVAHIARVGRVCSHASCESLAGARLAPDGSSVVYWGESRSGSTAAWQPWIKRTTLSGGGTRTLVSFVERNQWVGSGSADASGLVVFHTTESLLPADTPRTSGAVYPADIDVYAYDLLTGELELISVDSGGVPVGGRYPSVSADGRYIAYEGGSCGRRVIAVLDRWLGTTRCVPATGWDATLSANGRYLIFESDDVAENGTHLVDLAWQPPEWPVPSSIVMTGHDFTSIDFTWTPAQDLAQFPAALGTYEIYRDGAPEASLVYSDYLGGLLPSYSAQDLRPATSYGFDVQLLDATGGETTNGPQAVLQTATPTSDVSISIVDSPDPIGSARRVRYDITLANAGPDTAFDAAFDFSWPADFAFLAANPMAGSCVYAAPSSLSCSLGDVLAGASVQVVVLLGTGAQGTPSVLASASALGSDPDPSNSSGVQESLSVLAPSGGGGGGGGGGAGMVSSGPKSGGSVVGWGDSTLGQSQPPLSVAQRTARVVAAGVTHSCAIQAETGAVVCWGSDTYGESTPPDAVNGTLGTASALASGNHISCAIQSGTQAVVCWGLDGYGQSTPPASVDGTSGGATAIAVGWNHTCAIRADTGGAVCWGTNGDHQRYPPSSVNGNSGSASAIAVGLSHSCAIRAGTGNVVCWGAYNSNYGQLAVPPEVDGTSGTASAIEAGQRDTCAIQEGTGRVFCWGANWYGIAPPPASLDGSSGTARALAVSDTACAIQAETNAVVCWSGGGTSAVPSQIDGRAGTALALSGRQSHFCAIQADTHAAVCWGGSNSSGETDVPTDANGSGGLATAVAAGADHGCAIAAANDAVVCWGDSAANQLAVPAGVDGSAGRASALAVGAQHSCAIQSRSGAVLCWGANANGQSTPPAEVNGSLGTARAIAAGGAHSCAIQDGSNAVVCWGDGALGQGNVPLAVDGTAGTASALATGAAHSCAIQAETGHVLCWGDNSAGQITVSAEVDGSVPGATASAIAAGDLHSCAIRSETGAVVCWGSDASGQSTPPAQLDGINGHAIAIAAGGAYSCALQADTQAVVCWGDPSLGRTTPPGSLDGEAGRALALATGAAHGLALYVPEPGATPLAAAALLALALLRGRFRWRGAGASPSIDEPLDG